MRRNDVASTSFRRHVPIRFLKNQCQISVPFIILKSDNIENSRIELRGIVLPVPSNQIQVTFIIILPFNLVHLWFFPVSHRNWRKRWVDYWGAKGYVAPLSQIIGGPAPPPPSSYAYDYKGHRQAKREIWPDVGILTVGIKVISIKINKIIPAPLSLCLSGPNPLPPLLKLMHRGNIKENMLM